MLLAKTLMIFPTTSNKPAFKMILISLINFSLFDLYLLKLDESYFSFQSYLSLNDNINDLVLSYIVSCYFLYVVITTGITFSCGI